MIEPARFALLLGISLLACRDPRMDQMQRAREIACQCKDAACVNAALAQLPSAGPKNKARAQRLAAEILQCLAEVGDLAPEAIDAGPPSDATSEARPDDNSP
jgi:hypothetical protein